MDFKGKTLVVGTGISGIAAAALLIRHGIDTVLYDSSEEKNVEEIRSKDESLKEIVVLLGELSEKEKRSFANVVLSPGVPTDLPFILEIKEAGALILGEVELAYLFQKGKTVAITGTNGKTTTTALTGEIMKRAYKDVKVVGNIGIPYTQIVDDTTSESVMVAELSSFQLETIHTFHPEVSAILNLTPDHLNRHYTMENYAAAKENITMNQTKENLCILNYENEYTRKFADHCNATVIFFSSAHKLENGFYLDGENICYGKDGTEQILMNVNEMQLVGVCNFENVMAAIAMGMAMNVPMDEIIDAVKNFQAVEHRIEYVTTKRGIKFYNDSKGTNPDAAIQGIRAMKSKTCLIGGGYDKKSEYDEWIQAFDGKVKKLVLIGQTKEKIAETAEKCGFHDYVFAKTLEEAIDICYSNANEGENVLLSPACASWGMFPNYEERGRIFKEYVNSLKE